MALDQRQTQIREGAGLEESRLNREFIDLLQKVSMPVLVIIAILAVGYAFKQRYDRAQKEKLDMAFGEIEAASNSAHPSPDTLRSIADEYQSIIGVYLKGSLRAGDAYLDTVRSGVKPGAELKPDGSLAKPEDVLSDTDKAYHLAQAQAMYERVSNETAGKPAYVLMRLESMYGLAAVAECKGDFDAAKKHYEDIIAMVEKGPWAIHATVAKGRIASLDSLKTLPRVYKASELPKPPEPPKTEATGADSPSAAPSDAPKADAPGGDAPKPEAPAAEGPKEEPKPAETPSPSTPASDPPAEPQPPKPDGK